jgi:hypothetical protein
MELWIGVGVVLAVVVGLAGLASWRRRGRFSGDLLADQRPDLSENAMHTRSRGQYGR